MPIQSIAVVDIETTGRNPQVGTIVEVGICELDLQTGAIRKLFNSVCREAAFTTKFEARSLAEAWIFQHSTLTPEDVLKAPAWDDIKDSLQQILTSYPVTAYNQEFDFNFFRNRGLPVQTTLPDAMHVATPVLKLPYPKRSIQIYPPQMHTQPYKWPSVEETWRYLYPETPYRETHRAYDDATHEAQLIYGLFQRQIWAPAQKN